MNAFRPHLSILPRAQKQLWPALAPLRPLGYVLHGGTAVGLRLGHRQSVDFDFFTDRPLDRGALMRSVPSLAAATAVQDQSETFVVLCEQVKLSFFGGVAFGRVGAPEVTADGVAAVASLRDLLSQKLKVVMQRLESKDYRDIAAMLRHGESLAEGMAGASALFGPTFSSSECAKALVYFKGGDLDRVSSAERKVLLEAVRCLNLARIPEMPLLSHSLLAPDLHSGAARLGSRR